MHAALTLPAVLDGDELVAPTVGTWRPALGQGAPLVAGAVLGTLDRAGRTVAVTVPARAAGVAVEVIAPGTWVAYGERLIQSGIVSGAGSARPAVSARPTDVPEDVTLVTAETDGTVYLHPEPGSPPFVAVGTAVGARATLALVEVMKTFTPARTPIAGTIARVCVDDGAPVEAGDALFWIRADG